MIAIENLKLADLIKQKNNEEDFDDKTMLLKLKEFSKTRWTMSHASFVHISNNLEKLCNLWEDILSKEKGLKSDVKACIIGVNTKSRTFDFAFHLELSIMLFSQTDALSQTLQSSELTLLDGAALEKKPLKQLNTTNKYSKYIKKTH